LNSTHCQGKHHEKFNASIAFAALLLSGTAFAGSVQPVAGEAPWFNAPVQAASSVQRQDVQADAARHLPVAGEMAPRAPRCPARLTRAEVRQATRDAIAKGYAAGHGRNRLIAFSDPRKPRAGVFCWVFSVGLTARRAPPRRPARPGP
jgi:hypothetical protein